MIYVLAIILVFLLFISYILNHSDLVAPSFIFTLSFVFSVFWALLYADVWELNSMYFPTIIVIVGGILEFIFVSFIVKSYFINKPKQEYYDYKEECQLNEIKISIIIKIFCLIFSMISFYLCLNSVIKTVNGSWSNIIEAISQYNNLNKFSDTNITLSKFAGISKLIVNAMVYWYIYIILNNYLAKRKIEYLSIGIVITSIMVSMTTGGRLGVVNIFLAFISIFYILSKKKAGYKNKLNFSFRFKLLIISIPIIFIMIFPQLAELLGRNISGSKMYNVAIYCGAEIKNLDVFLVQKYSLKNSRIYNSPDNQTFRNLITWIGPKLGIWNADYKHDLPFVFVNNLILGNVYTTFYAYIYDFGYIGVLICVFIMAFISQFVYEKGKRYKLKNKPSMWILIYSYIFSSLVLSFFSNEFFERVLDRGLFYSIIFWYFANYFFSRIKINRR